MFVSGGEKTRVNLTRILLRDCDMLLLDEPTNHLDLYSKDILLEALKKFEGTIIFVSHDRSFMEDLSTKVLELSPGEENTSACAKLFYGNYGYYLEKKQADIPAEQPSYEKKQKTGGEEKRTADKQKQACLRRFEKQESEILRQIGELEAKKTALENELSNPDVYSDGEKAKKVKQKLDECAADIETKTVEWEEINVKMKGNT